MVVIDSFYDDFINSPLLDDLPVFPSEKYDRSDEFERLKNKYENFGIIEYTTQGILQVDANFAFNRNSISGVITVFYNDLQAIDTLVKRFKGLKKHTVQDLMITNDVSDFFPGEHQVRMINFTVENT